METILNKLKFYDIFGYLIPGILTIFIIKFFYDRLGLTLEFSLNNKAADFVLLAVLSYILGLLIHELSQIVEQKVLKPLWDGFPSERALLKDDKLLSDEDKEFYYSLGKDILNREINPNSKTDSHRYFEKIRETLRQEKLDEKAEVFNAHYGMSRNLLLVSLLCLILSILVIIKNNFSFTIFDWINLITFLTTTALFGLRVQRFGERFVKCIFIGYFEYIKKEAPQFVIGSSLQDNYKKA